MAKAYVDFSDDEIEIIMSAKKSYLVKNGKHWSKKTNSNFDVTMGSYDGAETCDLVRLFLLSELRQIEPNLGLFRDDGLGLSKLTPRQLDIMKKKICAFFSKHKLDITIDVNKKVVNLLDITLNLNNETYKPFTKPNSTPAYVHRLSNHPPNVTKNIPAAVNKRLSEISSD